jgi:hypothetical protein
MKKYSKNVMVIALYNALPVAGWGCPARLRTRTDCRSGGIDRLPFRLYSATGLFVF